MKNLIKYTVVCVVLLLVSCSKNITLNVPMAPSQMVIEGHIEPGTTGYLYLSHNFNFYGTISITSILTQDVIHGAHIAISDGTTVDSMYETNPGIGFYQNKILKGVVGKTYYLTVVANGQTATASTTLTAPVKLDSIWFQLQPNMDSLGFMWAILNDPPIPGNSYRWLAKRINKIPAMADTTYVPPDQSAFNDQLINGKKFQFFYGRGELPGSRAADDSNIEAGYFKIHDTVVIKFCTISTAAYNFYNIYYFQLNNTGNPFGSPAPITGNITGGLGIWCGYGSYLDTVVCK